MTLQLFAHPFSSYCQKALIAFYEKNAVFEYRHLGPDQPENQATLAAIWPITKFPVLLDGDRPIVEATIIIEYLDHVRPDAARMIPGDRARALECRMLDRVFDNYVMTPMQRIVADAMRPLESRDAQGASDARALLGKAYDWLDNALVGRTWAVGDDFTLADCAAAPALFYADWVHPIGDRPTLAAYRARLLARPSVARCVEEARPYRPFFPPGAPDRD